MYVGLVYHTKVGPDLRLYKKVPFKTIYHTKAAIGSTSVNHQFSLNASCLVRGVIALYSPAQTAVGLLPKPVLGALGSIIPPNTHLSKAYF